MRRAEAVQILHGTHSNFAVPIHCTCEVESSRRRRRTCGNYGIVMSNTRQLYLLRSVIILWANILVTVTKGKFIQLISLHFVPSSNLQYTTELWRGRVVVQLLQTERSRVQFPIMSLTLESTQDLTEMRTRNISWGWRRPVHRADKLTTLMCRMSWGIWEPQPPGTPRACNMPVHDCFTLNFSCASEVESASVFR